MSYMDGMQMGDHHMLDNVFVDPASHKVFLATGMWPDKTMLVKENRRADTRGVTGFEPATPTSRTYRPQRCTYVRTHPFSDGAFLGHLQLLFAKGL